MSDDLKKMSDQKISREILQIQQQMEAVAETDIPRLPEHVFKQVFLPFFAGDENPAVKVDISNWVNVAGNLFQKVHVVDVSNKVLFTVPPVFDRNKVNPVSNAATTMMHVVATFAQYNNVHPAQGARYLNNELSKRALVMTVPANVIEELETWNKIFERYGRPPIMKAPMTVQSFGSDDKGITDYDPL